MKKLLAGIAAAFLISTAAMAGTGIAPNPNNGPGLTDGTWLNGLAGGQNESYISGVKAAGSNQATATQLPAGIAVIEIDTVPGSSGVNLPTAIAGTELTVYNSTATTLLYYPTVANNPLTAAQDTINGGTSLSVTSASGGTVSFFMCAKNGVWAAK